MTETGARLPSIKILFAIFLGVVFLQTALDIAIPPKLIILGIAIDEIVIIFFLPLAILKLAGFEIFAILPFKKSGVLQMLIVVCLTLGAAVLLSYLKSVSSDLIPVPDILLKQQTHMVEVHSWFDLFSAFCLISVIAPFCEEILFRGLIQNTLENKYGSGTAITLTSILFALMHTTSFEPHLYLLMGLLFSWIFSVTRTLRTVIICHAINNTWVIVNNVQGISFPMGEKMGGADIILLAASGLMVTAGLMWTIRQRRARAV